MRPLVPALVLAAAAGGLAPGAGIAAPVDRLIDLVARLSPATLRDAAALERALSVRLAPAGGHESFAFHAAHDVEVAGLPVARLDYRVPRDGGGATAGPILVLTLAARPEDCIGAREALRAFPDLAPSGPPSPHARDPDAYRVRHDGAARLALGFPARGPDCLRSIVYDVEASR